MALGSFVSLVAFVCFGGVGVAQDVVDSVVDTEDPARAAFVAGAEAASEQRWADSERHFARSYALSGVSAALFNRAIALRNLGRDRDARDAFDTLLAHEDLDDTTRAEAERFREEASSRVARLLVAGLEVEPHDVEVDGVRQPDEGERPLALELDPGEHALVVTRGGYTAFRWAGTLAPSQVLALEASLRPSRRPRRWVLGVVGAVVVVGAAIAIAVAASRGGGAAIQPMSDIVLRAD